MKNEVKDLNKQEALDKRGSFHVVGFLGFVAIAGEFKIISSHLHTNQQTKKNEKVWKLAGEILK